MRVFLALDFPEGVLKEVQKIQEMLPEFEGKKTELKNLHLTLKFLGEVDDFLVERITESLSKVRFSEFDAELGELGVFSENVIRIVWVEIKGCSSLQREVDDALKDFFKKEDRFMGHLTIARVKNINNKPAFLKNLKEIKFPKLKFRVDEFKLVKSSLKNEGPDYSALKTYSLKKRTDC